MTVLFEFVILGDVARVAAVDEATGIEAVVMGPARTPRFELEALALRKLEKLLAGKPPPPRRGRLA